MGLKWYEVDSFKSLSLRVNDLLLETVDPTVHPDLLFIAVDEPSVNRFGRWPWDRSILATGLQKLEQADAVMIDMIFSEPTAPKVDQLLGESLASIPSVCGFFLRHNATQNVDEEQRELLFDSTLERLQIEVDTYGTPHFGMGAYAEVNTVQILENCSISGTFTTERDADALFRRYPIAYYFDDMLFPSLGIQALRLAFDSDLKRLDESHLSLLGKVMALDDNGFVYLNYYKKDAYQQLSFEKLYDGDYPANFFKGKIVIIGITEVGVTDVRATPIGTLSGALLHYTFVSNLLNDELIKRIEWLDYVSMFILFGLVLLIGQFVKTLIERISLYLFIGATFMGITVWVFMTYYLMIDLFYTLMILLLGIALVEVRFQFYHEKDEKFIKDAFSNYLSAPLLEKLLAEPQGLQLGGEKRELSILFSDIRSFTTISEKMPPEQLSKMLNRYFNPMSDAVKKYGGMVDKYIGDAVMAFFNAPVALSQHPQAACDAALEMITSLEVLNRSFKAEGLPEIKIGIGINTAEVVVGNFGADDRFNYTVIGDGVNLASRVEGLNKRYGSSIIITEYTQALLSSQFLTRYLEAVQVKGKEEYVVIYELLENSAKNQKLCQQYDVAMALYKEEHFVDALVLFEDISQTYSDDVSAYFAKKCQ